MSKELLSTRAAAKILSISESTVRRWCDEGKLRFVRTVGGHRKIPVDALLQLSQETGQPIARSTIVSSCSVVAKRPLNEPANLLSQSLIAGNEQDTLAILTSAIAQGHSIVAIGDQLVAPAMIEVGRQWEQREINVAIERRASQLALQGLFEIERMLPTAPESAPLALGGTPGQDHSQVGTKLVELVLKSMNWRTCQLGAGIPLSDISDTCRSVKPDLVWLSVIHVPSPKIFMEDYRTHMEPLVKQMTRIAVGGRGLDASLRQGMQYSFFGKSLADFQTYAAGLPVSSQSPLPNVAAPMPGINVTQMAPKGLS